MLRYRIVLDHHSQQNVFKRQTSVGCFLRISETNYGNIYQQGNQRLSEVAQQRVCRQIRSDNHRNVTLKTK